MGALSQRRAFVTAADVAKLAGVSADVYRASRGSFCPSFCALRRGFRRQCLVRKGDILHGPGFFPVGVFLYS
jgi:hypothetical protein